MFDISWSELLLFMIVAVIAIGPKQLPDVLYAIGRVVRRMQYMRFALSKQFEDFMEQNDLNQLRNIKNPVSDSALLGGQEDDEQEQEREQESHQAKTGDKNNESNS